MWYSLHSGYGGHHSWIDPHCLHQKALLRWDIRDLERDEEEEPDRVMHVCAFQNSPVVWRGQIVILGLLSKTEGGGFAAGAIGPSPDWSSSDTHWNGHCSSF